MDSQAFSEILHYILGSPENRALDRIMLVDMEGHNMIVLDTGNLTDMFAEKSKSSPATKKSIEEMPTVTVTEIDGGECAICLDEHDVGSDVREMPCKHRFHSGCIEKWLGIHGSCPVCRYEMPLEEEEKVGDGEIRVGVFILSGQARTIGEEAMDLD